MSTRPVVDAELWPWLTLLAICTATFSMSCVIHATPAIAVEGESATGAIFYAGQIAMSAQFYERADVYFHRGVRERPEQAFEHGIFRSLSKEISPEGHAHAHGECVNEVLPWLRLATKADPKHVEAYMVAAFWLSTTSKRPDLAEEVLQEAKRNNPGDYQLRLASAQLYLRQGRHGDAKRELDAGLLHWPGRYNPELRDTQIDKASLLLYRAILHEQSGEITKAIDLFTEILQMFPNRTHLESRIAELKEHGRASLLPSEYLNDRLTEEIAHAQTCPRESETHEHEHKH